MCEHKEPDTVSQLLQGRLSYRKILLFLMLALVVFSLLWFENIIWVPYFFLYFACLFCFDFLAERGGKKIVLSSGTVKKCRVLVFFLLTGLFWGQDLVSSVYYKILCSKQEGLIVHKTLEQWKEENPGQWEKNYIYPDELEWFEKIPEKTEYKGETFYLDKVRVTNRIARYKKKKRYMNDTIEEIHYILCDYVKGDILAEVKKNIYTMAWTTTARQGGRIPVIQPLFFSCGTLYPYGEFHWSFVPPKKKKE